MRADPADLRRRWHEFSKRQPNYSRNAIARELGVREVELLASRVGFGAMRLAPRWDALFGALGALGRVKSLTSNMHASVERTGRYSKVQLPANDSIHLGGDIDLRITPSRLSEAFAYEPPEAEEPDVGQSVEFYDQGGEAVHRVLLVDESSSEQFYQLVAGFLGKDQADWQETSAPGKALTGVTIDRDEFLEAWSALTGVNDLVHLLRKYALTHGRAVELAAPRFARKVSKASLQLVFGSIVRSQIQVAVQVGNHACVQSIPGPFLEVTERNGRRILTTSDAVIQLRDESISASWIVEVPSSNGSAFSLNLFDAEGNEIAAIRDISEPNTTLDGSWRAVLASLP